jgi:acyl transferase domain-containing protein
MKTVFMFSGQGSQYYHMGADLYLQNPSFRAKMQDLDNILQRSFGWSAIERIYDRSRKKIDPMDDIGLSSASIYMIEIALSKLLMDNGIQPDYLLGASLGSFAAAALSGCVSAESQLPSVVDSSYIIRDCCPDGLMLAVLGSQDLFIDSSFLRNKADLAAVNFDKHFTISTSKENLTSVTEFLEHREITYFKLPVTRAYHSRWIEGAKEQCFDFFEGQKYRPPQVPIICCAQGGEIEEFSTEQIWRIIREPIWFSKTVLSLENRGPYRYIDVGPSGTLATFLKYLLPENSQSQVFSIMGPMLNSVANFERLITSERRGMRI